MRSVFRTTLRSISRCGMGVVWITVSGGLVAPAVGQAAAPAGSNTATPTPEASVEEYFEDFLHYAKLGLYGAARASAEALLAHPDLDPVALLHLSTRHRNSVDTLLIIIANSSIGETAQRVLDVIEEGEFRRRKDPSRIQINIAHLGGTPQAVDIAIRHLAESGEYAIPQLVETLLDPSQTKLWPRVISALPLMGKGAVGPLVMALDVDDEDVRQNLIHALGEIGYPQAVPYLRKLIAAKSGVSNDTKQAATRAIARIESLVGRSVPGSVDELFLELAEKYYDEDDSVRADPRLAEANVWSWDAKMRGLRAVPVSQKIFGSRMAMRCTQEALQQRYDYSEAIALWLAANVRRESRLGMNIQSSDPDEIGDPDPSRPDVFPRALYYTQAAGPRYAHLVLQRAVDDRDSAVALGAIEALRVTAGATSLIGTEDYKQPLAQSLRFPDLVVRIRAALALGAALPKTQFSDSQFVVPVLANTLLQSGRPQVLVVDADEANRNRVVSALRAGDREVIGADNFHRGIEQARAEFPNLSAIFLSTGITEPDAATAIGQLRAEFAFAKIPVVLLAEAQQSVVARDIAATDDYVEPVGADAPGADLEAGLARARKRTGQTQLSSELALSMALEAAETLANIASDGRTIYDVSVATPALIASLGSSSRELQTAAASVLALVPSPEAQRAIAYVALDPNNAPSLRNAAFGALSDSAKRHRGQLEDAQIVELVRIAREEGDLKIRTAASQALGALNLASNKASEIIRSYSNE